MKISFLVPSTTSNRDWKCIQETYLFQILFNGLEKQKFEGYDITVYVGYNIDDAIYSIDDERMKCDAIFTKFKIVWIPMTDDTKGKPTWIWNRLGEQAIEDGFEYLKLLGDDIQLPKDSGWLGCFVNKLKKNNNIGFSAGWSNNNAIPTQFLVHKSHYEIFGFFYPPAIHNYFCDDWMYGIYPEKYRNWLKQFSLLNLGGNPRYIPKDDKKLCELLIKRYRPKLNRHLQKINE